jgi:hypothetical protein
VLGRLTRVGQLLVGCVSSPDAVAPVLLPDVPSPLLLGVLPLLL